MNGFGLASTIGKTDSTDSNGVELIGSRHTTALCQRVLIIGGTTSVSF